MMSVRAPSRLHLGLFHLPPGDQPLSDGALAERAFGGVGIMVRDPGVEVEVVSAPAWSAEGPHAERALGFARRLERAGHTRGRAFRLVIRACPAQHVGLGTGTQLALTVAHAVLRQLGESFDPVALAPTLGRGQRSGLGIHGHVHGGFLIEGGKAGQSEVAPLLVHRPLPEAWRVLLVCPHALEGAHGPAERDAFRRLGNIERPQTDALCRLALLGMLPALVENHLDAFGEAVFEFNARVGEMFAPWQGGTYAHPLIAALVAFLRSQGLRGVGQSSWGPTTFAFGHEPEIAKARAAVQHRFQLADTEVIATTFANAGAAASGQPDLQCF